MTVKPEDLVEVWHLITANGDEPVEWEMGQALWIEVRRCIDECTIDAGDRLTDDGPLTLLGTPVDITEGTPQLRYRTNGELRVAQILGSMDERK